MKRKLAITVCALLMAMLLCLAVAVSAESVLDLSGYTDEEIFALSAQLQTEIVDRKLAKTASIPAGSYTAGKDFPAGRYNLICKTDSNHQGIVRFEILDSDNDTKWRRVLSDYVPGDTENTYSLDLEEGGILHVGFPIQLQICTGIVFE